MSQENVELVTNLQPAPDVDIAELFRSDEMWSTVADAVAPLFHPDFESLAPGVPGTEKVHVGLGGLRAAWLEWMKPWMTYRTEIKQAIDAGDRVLLLTQDYACHEGVAQEVKVDGSAVWTVRDGKIARACFYPARSEAFAAAGLTEKSWGVSTMRMRGLEPPPGCPDTDLNQLRVA
jgi:ketosteroid isomerase-like protein